MKTKNKMIAMVEIAIVLCSLFLVALPGVAAEQNQEMQGVSANTITTASEDDYVLDIYGNANEDDTIDMRDLTYVKLIFFGKKPETELADAKYDGKINPLDFIQIKLIIVGKEKEITIVDSADRIVTVKKPVRRAITLGGYDAELMYMLGEQDKIVGIANWMAKKTYYKECIPELTELPTVGAGADIDYEAVLALNPDLVTTWHYYVEEIDEHLPDVITVAGFDFFTPEIMREEMVKFGYIFNKKDGAKSYFDDFHDKYIDLIKARTEGISEEERPKVYKEWYSAAYYIFPSPGLQQRIDVAGGKLMFAELEVTKYLIEVNPEDVVARNPGIIIKDASSLGPHTGYDIDDPEKPKPLRDEIMSRPELAAVEAVKNGRVYILHNGIQSGLTYPIGIAYMAKWFQPELFEDLDPETVHQEYLDRLGSDYDVKKARYICVSTIRRLNMTAVENIGASSDK